MLTLQMIRIMSKIWVQEGLDMRMVIFRCFSTGRGRGQWAVGGAVGWGGAAGRGGASFAYCPAVTNANRVPLQERGKGKMILLEAVEWH